MKKERMDEVRSQVTNGVQPTLMEPWASSKDGIVKAFRKAMALCHHPNPHKRGTAAQVATILHTALEEALDAAEKEEAAKQKREEAAKQKEKDEKAAVAESTTDKDTAVPASTDDSGESKKDQ